MSHTSFAGAPNLASQQSSLGRDRCTSSPVATVVQFGTHVASPHGGERNFRMGNRLVWIWRTPEFGGQALFSMKEV